MDGVGITRPARHISKTSLSSRAAVSTGIPIGVGMKTVINPHVLMEILGAFWTDLKISADAVNTR